MLLTEYVSDVTKAIDEYSRTGLILSSELKTDARTEKIGLIKGSFVFIQYGVLLNNVIMQQCQSLLEKRRLRRCLHKKILPLKTFIKW